MYSENSIKYYGVFPNLKHTEYDSIESALQNCKYITIKEVHSFYENRVGKATWKNATTDYEFYSLKNDIVVEEVEINNWKLSYHGNYHYNSGSYSKTGVEFKIIDPFGQVAIKRLGTGMEGIIEGLKLFLDYSAERSMRYIELMEENRLLKAEIKQLTGDDRHSEKK